MANLNQAGVHYLTGVEVDGEQADPRRPVNGIPKFFIEYRKNKKTGETVPVEMVSIVVPGDQRNSPVRKVNDAVRAKYKFWYDQWRNEVEDTPVGTPLSMWPTMTPPQVAQLQILNIFTVEQLAAVSDSNLQNIPFGRTVKNKAIKWLEVKEKSDALDKYDSENKALKDMMRQMQDQIDALTTAAEKSKTDDKPKSSGSRFSKESS